MATLIGSRAAKHWFPDYREPRDWDYLIAPGESRIGDCHIAEEGLVAFLDYDIAPPEMLYTLKVSHAFWPIHWEKTMHDIKFFQSKGIKLDEALFKELYKFWEVRHSKKRANLNVSNEKFFTSSVPRKYVHDSLHEAVKYYDEPMYKKVKDDLSKAFIPRKNFEALSFEDKCKLAREETYVTALERYLIPGDFKMDELTAYRKASKLLITSMSKGFFPKFIVENWITLNKPDDHPWIGLFKEGVNNGTVKNTERNPRVLQGQPR